MEISERLLVELQRRLKVGNRRGVHLNAIPASSRYKFDITRLSAIDKSLPNRFITALLSEQPLKFRISWKENVPDLNSLFEEEQTQLVRITKAFENLINQTEAIESEKGINTFGFGFPLLIRRDRLDDKLTVAPLLIWSLRIRQTREFNTWEILRDENDAVYVNEVLINHLQSDANIEVPQIASEMLEDGLIDKNELLTICCDVIKAVTPSNPHNLEEIFEKKLLAITPIPEKSHLEKLPLNHTNSYIEFSGLYSIFEVQKQNIIQDYSQLLELEGLELLTDELSENTFQPISSVDTDPSQQSVLHSLQTSRNLLIQGPPGTGKSQTLMAILINALENGKKTIVVCEKRTALEVLHEGLKRKSLQSNCVLIKDIVNDRRSVVDSVRDRVDDSEYRKQSYRSSKSVLNNYISRANYLINNINRKHVKVGDTIISNKNWTHLVGELLAEVRDCAERPNLAVDKSYYDFTSDEMNQLLLMVEEAEVLYSNFRAISSSRFLNPLKLVGENPFEIERIIEDDFHFYSSSVEKVRNLLDLCHSQYIFNRKRDLENQTKQLESLIVDAESRENSFSEIIKTSEATYRQFRSEEIQSQLDSIERVLDELDGLFNTANSNPDALVEEKIGSFGFRIGAVFSRRKKEALWIHGRLIELFSDLSVLLQDASDLSAVKIEGNLRQRQKGLSKLRNAIYEVRIGQFEKIQAELDVLDIGSMLSDSKKRLLSHEFKKSFPYLSDASISQVIHIEKAVRDYLSELDKTFSACFTYAKSCKDICYSGSTGSFAENKVGIAKLKYILRDMQASFPSKIEHEFANLNLWETDTGNSSLDNLPELQQRLDELLRRIATDSWTTKSLSDVDRRSAIRGIEELIAEKESYFSSSHDSFLQEFHWYRLYNRLEEKERTIIDELKGKTNWRRIFLYHYLDRLLTHRSSLDLPTDDKEHTELDSCLGSIQTEQLKYIKQYWYSKQIDVAREFEQRPADLSIGNLYNKRSSNKHKRLSLRQIIQYDADLFTTFFPIILTTPDVASNLFKGMNGYFDIVMFDEASQLRLEDNLPAMLKGKQIVIAGDEHQMPPSNYFSKLLDGTADDEDEIEEEKKVDELKQDIYLSCESLLDFGEALNFNKKFLDFHYRSRHPYLIDFSNYAFYNQRLRPLPNRSDYVPIKYIPIGGTFSDHTNDAEAQVVLQILEKNIDRLPNGSYPSVGIATFNITQRNLIKSKIIDRMKMPKSADFAVKIQELEKNGLFIKNLENIQGDERDVIIISGTYGVSKDRRFAQRFGPLTHTKGYKLLNVIITRAKYKVYMCSSVPEQVFLNYKDYLVSEGSNNKKAVLYAYLAYCKAVSEQDNELRVSVLTSLAENTRKSVGYDASVGQELESPFEEEVYHVLVEKLGKENLTAQLRYGGFRIDIVYDKKIPGIPRVAIECDGAKFHSSREAYLHDRHRQRILEGQGFKFHRIWSTNWWRNPTRETNRLVDFIESVTSAPVANYKENTDFTLTFSHEVDLVGIPNIQHAISFSDESNTQEVIKVLTKSSAPTEKIVSTKEVKPSSKVLVKYLNNGKTLHVQLVQSENNKNLPGSDVQKIYNRSILATSLLGKTEGETVKVGNLDNYVEIIKISN